MRAPIVLFSLLALTACGQMGDNLAALREKNPPVGNFSQSLASEYLAYAESLQEEGHPLRAGRFAGKGLKALEDGDVAPEEKEAYAEERKVLMETLTQDVKDVAPARAARAQLMFDCLTDKEDLCKDGYELAMSDLQFITDALQQGADNHYAVDFAAGSAQLSENAQAMIDIVAVRVANLKDYKVAVKAGSKPGRLTTARVLAVEKALIARGVNAGNIKAVHKHKEVELSTDRLKARNRVMIVIKTYAETGEK